MFGYVVANPEKLSEKALLHYRAVYCGLCKTLGSDRKQLCRLTLTYDLTFLIIFLSGVFGEEYSETESRCALHPAGKKKIEVNRFTEFAADMNIFLAYLKMIDDINDDRSVAARLKQKLFQSEAEKAEKRYPELCGKIRSALSDIEKAEKENCLIPDIPASSFGKLLGEIFAFYGEGQKEELYNFGEALGKFIYIADAAADKKHDIKKGKYNPLLMFPEEESLPMLRLLMADAVQKYRLLLLKKDNDIIENVLLSGVWSAFSDKRHRKEKQ